MKKQVTKLTSLTFELSSVNRAVVTASGDVPTLGWINPELGNDKVSGDILHTDFLAEPPSGASGAAVSPISVQRSFLLRGRSQEIIVHAATGELSVTLPSIGDPP